MSPRPNRLPHRCEVLAVLKLFPLVARELVHMIPEATEIIDHSFDVIGPGRRRRVASERRS